MATPNNGLAGAGFELASLPTPTSVRDPDTGNVVDGYKVVVRSKISGATAVLEIPASRYTASYLAAQAAAALAPLDETIASFGSAMLTGSTPPSSS